MPVVYGSDHVDSQSEHNYGVSLNTRALRQPILELPIAIQPWAIEVRRLNDVLRVAVTGKDSSQ